MISPANRIKIMYVIGQLSMGGTERQLLELVRNLDPEKFEAEVVSLSSQAPLGELFRATGCEVHVLERETRGRLFVFQALYSLFSGFQPDIVHTFGYASRAVIPIALFFRNTKKVASIRTQFGRGTVWLDNMLNSLVDCTLTNSKDAAKAIRSAFFHRAPCFVIYNGIDLLQFDAKMSLRMPSIPVAMNSNVVCMVARFHPVKGHLALLEAFSKVVDAVENVELWLIGSGSQKEALEQRAAQLGINSKVVFWGEQENVIPFLAHADVGVLSSEAEGLPNAIIEYMAAGLPVIATKVGGIPELVTQGSTGLLVNSGDTDALALAIIDLLQDTKKARRFGQAGRFFVEQNLDMRKMVDRTERLYFKLLNQEIIGYACSRGNN